MKLPSHIVFDHLRPDYDRIKDIARRGADAVPKATRTLLETRSSSSPKCPPGNNSALCVKPVSSSSETLPIVLGAAIPIGFAVILLLFLHRRIKRKQRIEDANDPHKSLDFGVESTGTSSKKRKGGKKGAPEMTVTDLANYPPKHGRELSMDMLGSPYLLPAGLQGSHESLHSMSRSFHDEHDPYRPVTAMRPSADISRSRSPRLKNENASVYSASTLNINANENANLVANARPMSQSYPKRGESMAASDAEVSEDMPPLRQMHSANRSVPSSRKESSVSTDQALGHISEAPLAPSQYDGPSSTPPPEVDIEERPQSVARPPRKDSAPAGLQAQTDRHMSESSFYGDDVPPIPQPPEIAEPDNGDYDIDPSMIYTGRFSIDTPAPSQQFPVQENRMSRMGLRPLPPDNPEENAEQRANRIRSFYKEYFDDSKPNPASGQWQDDYDADFSDAAIYDPQTGSYFYGGGDRPFAQPQARRAMTPPPGGAHGAHGRYFSSMSGKGNPRRPPPPARAEQKPQKKLPPPLPLKSLPTPHLLKEDTMVLSPIDFAPPSTFRDAQNGRRPDSPMGIQRPFSPSVRAYSPLVPAANELSVMPSPHHLRKSGTFTGLDFAKLPRFRGQESSSASDAGSIRSARSGISAVQMDAVRAGAYRVSRIPKEMVTTRDDLALQLKPTMNLTLPA